MRSGFLAMTMIGVAAVSPAAAEDKSADGLWRNPAGTVDVQIEPCGAKICGRVVRADEKARADAARGGHPDIIGMDLFEDFRRTGPNRFRGRVFAPDLNRRFSGTLSLIHI